MNLVESRSDPEFSLDLLPAFSGFWSWFFVDSSFVVVEIFFCFGVGLDWVNLGIPDFAQW